MKETIACIVKAGDGFYFIEEFVGSTTKDAIQKAKAEFPESRGYKICDSSTGNANPLSLARLFPSLESASAAL